MPQGSFATTHWDPDQYLKFSDHRLRPAREMLDRVPIESPSVIYDLGCGTGNVTRLLVDRWPTATLYGLDNSREMLAKAAAEPGPVRWIEADLRRWQPGEPPDLIFSNATLHWVEDHLDLFPRLVGALKPGGVLAVQMPRSWAAPSHRLMRETLENGGPGGQPLGTEELRREAAQRWVLPSEEYWDLLAGLTTSLDIWETEYLQILEGEDPVLEWVKGTGLRPILNGLGDEERETFLTEYKRRLRQTYPVRAGGRTIYPFRRLFIVAAV